MKSMSSGFRTARGAGRDDAVRDRCYEERIVTDAPGGARFAEKTVIVDSRRIDTLLSIPL
jgi:hypothetical protein